MIVLGINAYHGDASAALLRDGALVVAVAEERLRRVKHWAGFPTQAIRACLSWADVGLGHVDHVALSRDAGAHLGRKVLHALRARPRIGWLRDRVSNRARVRRLGARLAEVEGERHEALRAQIHPVEHHPAHLASSFFASPFEEAAVCSLDGFGDFVSASWAIGRGSRLLGLDRIHFPHSLGLLYLAVTQYLGFPRYGDEGKVMGLAAYGEPDYAPALRQLLRLSPGGRFVLDLSYFRHGRQGVSMTWEDGEPLLGPVYSPRLGRLLGPPRRPDEPITPRHEAIAASLQTVFEEAALHILRALHAQARLPRLCLAGGCALNSVLIGKIRAETPFREVYVPPAAGDDGTALGAALAVWHHELGQPRRFVMEHAYWGPAFGEQAIDLALRRRAGDLGREGCRAMTVETPDDLCRCAAERLEAGQIVGWFQGRMEWGPRALGNRSILADPRRPEMREILNAKIKHREPFRPFAASILEDALDTYFVGAAPDPFMTTVYPVQADKRPVIAAVTHVDGSSRVHSVSMAANPLYGQLLREFEKRTGVPLLLNTSFNESEPITHSPDEALDCFLRTRMDVLVMGRRVVSRGDPR